MIIPMSLVGLNDYMDMLTCYIITLFQISANTKPRTPHVRKLMAKEYGKGKNNLSGMFTMAKKYLYMWEKF